MQTDRKKHLKINILKVLKKLKNIIKGKFFTDKEELKKQDWYTKRLEICGACPKNSKNVPKKEWNSRMVMLRTLNNNKPFCTICGCEIEALSSLEISECSDNPPKWNSVEN